MLICTKTHLKAVFGHEPYRVLGLKPGANETDIKAAFRRLALRHHPDVAGEEHRATFETIRSAYDTLLQRRNSGGEVGQPETAETVTEEDKQVRVRNQLDGLRSRAAQRQRREHEKAQRAAMRVHSTRGSMSGVHSSDAARERIQTQLATLLDSSSVADEPSAHRVQVMGMLPSPREASSSATGTDTETQDASPDDMSRLIRLARLARFWRDSTGFAQGSVAGLQHELEAAPTSDTLQEH